MDLRKLPDLEGWQAGDDFDPRGFLLVNTTVGEAAALSLLLWPEFVEYRGRVFLSFLFEHGSVDVWFKQFEGDGAAVERTVNHIHLWDVFAPKSEADYATLPALAERVAVMWRSALERRFPGRQIVVAVNDGNRDYGPTISFSTA